MVKTEKDIRGQYAFDNVTGVTGERPIDPYGTLDVRGDGNIGMHQGTTLFDQEDEYRDEATGQVRAGRSAEVRRLAGDAGEEISIVPDSVALRGLGRNSGDAADEWMKSHGYTW